jgi:hypothetical protein
MIPTLPSRYVTHVDRLTLGVQLMDAPRAQRIALPVT